MSKDDTQLVCDPEEFPVCKCAGDAASPHECCCFASDGETTCGDCNATMIRINVNTGARVSA